MKKPSSSNGNSRESATIFHSHIKSSFEDVSNVCAKFKLIIESRLIEDLAGMIDLGVTEALTNVVRHSYGGVAGNPIEIRCFDKEDFLIIEIIDSGKSLPVEKLDSAAGEVFEFDPGDVNNIPTGGMGLSLIKSIFDYVEYEANEGKNKMTLKKKINK